MSEEKSRKLLEMREEEPQKKEKKAATGWKKEAKEWLVAIVVALIVFVITRTFLFTMIRVDGESMLETLHDGDRLFVSVLDVRMNGVENGDIIICKYPGQGNTYFVKRVIAQGGDKVQIIDGVTFVNEEMVDEPYITYEKIENLGPVTVPQGKMFVMGDNRDNSSDSRMLAAVGFLEDDMLVGKVQFIWWPFDRIGTVE